MRFRASAGSQAVMAPNHHFALNSLPLEPVSRTYQYRKIMKPMLERKRRARINKCLDELKDLMTGTLQADGENVSKLEKADILELTVRHLHRLRENNSLFVRPADPLNMEKFWAGFNHCATEVSKFLTKYDYNIGGDIIKHITNFVPNIPAAATAATIHYQRYSPLQLTTPPPNEYLMSDDKSLSRSGSLSERRQKQHLHVKDATMDEDNVWRPW